MWYIYAHKNKKNEIVYIGTGIKKRLSCAHYNKPTYSKLWNTYFKDYRPVVEILLEELTQEEAYLQEALAIKEFGPILNTKTGGKNGKYTKKVPKGIIKLNHNIKGISWQKEAHPQWGKHQSQTSKAQNAASNGVKPFVAIKLDCGVIMGPFFYRAQCAAELRIPSSPNIGSCLSGKLSSYKGYKFIALDV